VTRLPDLSGENLSTLTDAELDVVRLARAIVEQNRGRTAMPEGRPQPVLALVTRLVERGIVLDDVSRPPSAALKLILHLIACDAVPELLPRHFVPRHLPPDTVAAIEAALDAAGPGFKIPRT
jgi:hypothetical protein